MRKLLCLILVCLLFLTSGCAPAADSETSVPPSSSEFTESSDSSEKESSLSSSEEPPSSAVDNLINSMSLEDKVRQLFFVTVGDRFSDLYTKPDDTVKEAVTSTRAGGYILFAKNITTVEGTRALTGHIANNCNLAPFIGIDEEGGLISRLASAKLPGYAHQPQAADIGKSGDSDKAYNVGAYIGEALAKIGVNVDFAPDADVLTEPGNTVIGTRSFGSDPQLVADMSSAFSRGLSEKGILSAPKHFPGHGGTVGDSHKGFVSVSYDETHLNSVEYVPFVRAIANKIPFILVGHITNKTADGSGLPASLSSYFVTTVLRGQLGYNGIIITDAMDMGAIADNYDIGTSAVMALQAGVDMIMMPKQLDPAVNAVIKAVNDGTLTEERVNESLRRVLQTKADAGLIS